LTLGRLGTGRPGTPGIDRHLDQPTVTFSRQSRRPEPQDHTNRYTVTMSDGRGQAERAQSRRSGAVSGASDGAPWRRIAGCYGVSALKVGAGDPAAVPGS
jgi:hypothetical protein